MRQVSRSYSYFHPLKSGRNLCNLTPEGAAVANFHPLKSGRNYPSLWEIVNAFEFPSPQVGSEPFVTASSFVLRADFHPLKSGRNPVATAFPFREDFISIPSSRVGTKAKRRLCAPFWLKRRSPLPSTFGCPLSLRGSTAADPRKWRHFAPKLPPLLYALFKVPKTA